MADGVFNIAKGKVNEYVARVDASDPTNSVLVVMLLKVAEAAGTLEDYDTFALLLAGSNTEANFTNYARKTIDDSALTTPTPDDTNNWQVADFGDQTWTSAGGGTNNTLVKLIVGYDSDSTGGNDTNIVPLTHHDFGVTTNGTDLVATVANFFKAS